MQKVATFFMVLVLAVTPSFALVLPIPIDLPPGVDLVFGKLLGILGIGGMAVSDATTHTQLGAILVTTTATVAEAKNILKQLQAEFDLAKKMAEMMKNGPPPPGLRKWLSAYADDIYNLNAGWLHNANTGLPGYMQSVYPRPADFEVVFNKMPLPAQLRAKLAYSMGELLDGINEGALRNLGTMRATSPEADMIITNLMSQHFSPDESKHGTVQVLDRIGIATGATLQDGQDTKRLLGSLVEIEVARGMQQRNALYAAAEAEIARKLHGPTFTSSTMGDPSAAIAAFRW